MVGGRGQGVSVCEGATMVQRQKSMVQRGCSDGCNARSTPVQRGATEGAAHPLIPPCVAPARLRRRGTHCRKLVIWARGRALVGPSQSCPMRGARSLDICFATEKIEIPEFGFPLGIPFTL